MIFSFWVLNLVHNYEASTHPFPCLRTDTVNPVTEINVESRRPTGLIGRYTTYSPEKRGLSIYRDLSEDYGRTNVSSSSNRPMSAVLNGYGRSTLHRGWIQINKLYTPYVSSNRKEHQQYKIPVNLLIYYHMLETGSSKETEFKKLNLHSPTSFELEALNDLCFTQDINKFHVDMKLIDLATFYHHNIVNALFIKELPLDDPKSEIYKNWREVTKLEGGICRLRNMTKTIDSKVPFIGSKLLKIFPLTDLTLQAMTAFTTPNEVEIEFLKTILFCSNMITDLDCAKLVDVELVKKEYVIDFIMLFNDKFPIHMLQYQSKGTYDDMNTIFAEDILF